MSDKSCWILYDRGKSGTRIQCESVAEALNLKPLLIPVKAKFPWNLFPPKMWLFALLGIKPDLKQKWPKIIIAAGRSTVAPCIEIKKRLKESIKIIQLMNPRVDPKYFDLVIAPEHDHLIGDNVIQTNGTLNTLKKEYMIENFNKLNHHISHLPRPYHVVLLGGKTSRHKLNPLILKKMIDDLRSIAYETGGSVLLTPSRRTDVELVKSIPGLLSGTPHFISSDFYKGFLQAADTIMVTNDSVSMISEACFTEKPIYIYPLPGNYGKFSYFYNSIVKNNYARIFKGNLNFYHPPKLDEIKRIINDIKKFI